MTFKDFYNIHKGEDIYIIASGSSMNWVNPSFFENKISIGVNHVYRKYKSTYFIGKDAAAFPDSMINHKNVKGSKIFATEHNAGNVKHKKLNSIPRLVKSGIIFFKHIPNRSTTIPPMKNLNEKMIVSWSTITTAMHIAAYMGAKNIILCGHDCGTINKKECFDGYHTDLKETPWKNWNEYINWLSKIESQTLTVKKMLKDFYGCNIYSLNPFINFNLEGNTFNKNL